MTTSSCPTAARARRTSTPQQVRRSRRPAGVTSVSAVRSDNARVLGSTVPVSGIDGATIAGVYRFAWKDGSDAVLASLGNGAIVDSKWAKTHNLSVGSPLQVEASNGTKRTFVVRATYHPKFQAVFGGILIDRSHFDRMFPNPQNGYVFVNVASGASPSATAALAKSLRPFSDVTVQTHAGLDQDAIERHQDDARPSSTRSSRSP